MARIHHLNCATMRPFGGRLIDGTGHPLRRALMVCHCLLIETEQGLVLVDTGLGLNDVRRPADRLGRTFTTVVRPVLDPEETAVRQVERLGYPAADVRHIVLTHLDLDHAGGLSDFPRAKVHVHETEHRAAMARATRVERDRYRPPQWAHGPDWATYGSTEGDRWFGFEAVRALDGLPPDILLIPLAGHTRGHTAVAVRDDEPARTSRDAFGDTAAPGGPAWLLHAGDGYFFHGEMDRTRPRVTAGLGLFQTLTQVDGESRRRNQDRLRELAAAHGDEVEIFCAHDLVELQRQRRRRARAGADSGRC